MHSYFLAISLPLSARSRLITLCYGLPHVRWVEEENLHLTLRYFGSLTDQMLISIREHLHNLFFSPFSLVLQGIRHFQVQGHCGTLGVGIANHSELNALRKEIAHLLRDLHLPPDKHPFHPYITLGFYQSLNPDRLGEYLNIHADYQSGPIEVTSCLLMRALQTPKHVIYEIVDKYVASQLQHGED